MIMHPATIDKWIAKDYISFMSTRHKTKYGPYKLAMLLLYAPGPTRREDDGMLTVAADKKWLRDQMNVKADRLREYFEWTEAAIGAKIILDTPETVIVNLPLPGAQSPT